jgi:hypothetical protein
MKFFLAISKFFILALSVVLMLFSLVAHAKPEGRITRSTGTMSARAEAIAYDAAGVVGQYLTVVSQHKAVIENNTGRPQEYMVVFRMLTVGNQEHEESYVVKLLHGERYDVSYPMQMPVKFNFHCAYDLYATTIIHGVASDRRQGQATIAISQG